MPRRLTRSTVWGGTIYHPGDEGDLPEEAVKDLTAKGLFQGSKANPVTLGPRTDWASSSPYIDENSNRTGFSEDEVLELMGKQGLLQTDQPGSGNAPLSADQQKQLKQQQKVDQQRQEAQAKADEERAKASGTGGEGSNADTSLGGSGGDTTGDNSGS